MNKFIYQEYDKKDKYIVPYHLITPNGDFYFEFNVLQPYNPSKAPSEKIIITYD